MKSSLKLLAFCSLLIVAGKEIDSVIVHNRSRVGCVLGLDDGHVQR